MALMNLEDVMQNLTTADRSLLYHILVQQMETNRLLTLLVENKPQEAVAVNIDELHRQDLMKAIAKLPNNPKGWNKWATEDMRKHLEGAKQ